MKKLFIILLFISGLFAKTIIINNPNRVIKTYLSISSVNRIVLPEKILNLAFSKEKGLNIKIVNNQAFLKYEVIKKQKYEQLAGTVNPNSLKPIGKPQLVYKAEPCEVYFITQNKTYSFVFYPSKTKEPQTIIINDFTTNAKKILKYETDDDYTKTIIKIGKPILKGLVPFGYKMKKINKIIYKDFIFTTILKNIYTGIIYKVSLYTIKNNSTRVYKLNPKILYNLAKTPPIAIIIYYDNNVNYLLPYSEAKVLIFEKRK